MEDEQIPDFIRSYMDKLEDKGYMDFTLLAKEYLDSVKNFQTNIYPVQQRNLHVGNRFFGERKKIELKDTLSIIKADYEQKALAIAKAHGFKEADTTQIKTKEQFDRKTLKQYYKQQIEDALQNGRKNERGRSL